MKCLRFLKIIKSIVSIPLFLFAIGLTSQACGEGGEEPSIPSVNESSLSKQEASTSPKVTPVIPPVEIDHSTKTIKIPAIVMADSFNTYAGELSQFFVVSAFGNGPSLFVSHVSPLEVHRALTQIGGRPGDNLSRPSPGARQDGSKDMPDQKVEGSPIQINVSWTGSPKDYPLQDLIVDPESKTVAMRFGGNLPILQSKAEGGGRGVVACFFSCPGGVIGNSKYSARGFFGKKGRITAKENVLPPDGTEVTLTLKIVE